MSCISTFFRRSAKAPSEFIKESIAAHDIVIFGKSVDRLGSVTTDQVKRVAYQHDIQIHNLDKMDDGEAIQSALVEMTGVKGLPNVFVKGQCVGGNEATQRAVRTGKFMAMVTGQPGPIAMMSMSGGMVLCLAGCQDEQSSGWVRCCIFIPEDLHCKLNPLKPHSNAPLPTIGG